MNHLNAEVVGRFDSPGDCNKLLYAPLNASLTFRRTRRYQLEFDGTEDAAKAFLHRTLVDEVSEDLSTGDAPALDGFRFFIDYGMRPGALDLEKEAIMKFCKGSRDFESNRLAADATDFILAKLTIWQRVYIFGNGDAAGVGPEPFVRDIVNTAIHTWSVTEAKAHA